MARTKQIPLTTTYLQMLAPPEDLAVKPPVEHMHIERVREPSVPFYREMYDAIGGKWQWSERKKLTDDQVRVIIRDPDIFIYVLRSSGKIIGFAELDFRQRPDLELKYFGLVPECIGKGLGKYFLSWTINKAWELNPRRVWLHTCSNDHPRALDMYRKAGFVVYKEDSKGT